MQAHKTQAQLFKLLMHPTRLAILEILREGEQCVCHMEANLGLRQAAISQQLMVLREAGWVTDRRDGWNIFYRVIKPEIYPVIDAMGALSGEARESKMSKHSFSQEKACPCPKCNPGKDLIRLEAPGMTALESGSDH